MALGERADIIIYKARQVLGIKTLLEYFVDFELEREEHLPMSIPECAWNGNMTNQDFYFEHIGGYFPCIFRGYLSDQISYKSDIITLLVNSSKSRPKDIEIEQLGFSLSQVKPPIMEKNLQYQKTETKLYREKERTHTLYQRSEQLMCSISSDLELRLLSAFQTILLGRQRILKKNESPVDLFNIQEDQFPQVAKMAIIYPLLLEQGDCIYIPAYWWHQIDNPINKATISISYWYEASSEWLRLVFNGIENNQI